MKVLSASNISQKELIQHTINKNIKKNNSFLHFIENINYTTSTLIKKIDSKESLRTDINRNMSCTSFESYDIEQCDMQDYDEGQCINYDIEYNIDEIMTQEYNIYTIDIFTKLINNITSTLEKYTIILANYNNIPYNIHDNYLKPKRISRHLYRQLNNIKKYNYNISNIFISIMVNYFDYYYHTVLDSHNINGELHNNFLYEDIIYIVNILVALLNIVKTNYINGKIPSKMNNSLLDFKIISRILNNLNFINTIINIDCLHTGIIKKYLEYIHLLQ